MQTKREGEIKLSIEINRKRKLKRIYSKSMDFICESRKFWIDHITYIAKNIGMVCDCQHAHWPTGVDILCSVKNNNTQCHRLIRLTVVSYCLVWTDWEQIKSSLMSLWLQKVCSLLFCFVLLVYYERSINNRFLQLSRQAFRCAQSDSGLMFGLLLFNVHKWHERESSEWSRTQGLDSKRTWKSHWNYLYVQYKSWKWVIL
jgi:hypothetical protein